MRDDKTHLDDFFTRHTFVADGRHPLPEKLTLYSVGEPAVHVWYIEGGIVAISRPKITATQPDNLVQHRVIAVRRAGDFVGIEGLATDVYPNTARILGDSATLLRASLQDFLKVCRDPKRSTALIVAAARSLMQVPFAESDGTTAQRVAAWLLDADEQLLALPRYVVADLLGIRSETLSRTLNELAGYGIVKVSRIGLEITDRRKLERFVSQPRCKRVGRLIAACPNCAAPCNCDCPCHGVT
jgi:CRP-like cAMP-binding protein